MPQGTKVWSLGSTFDAINDPSFNLPEQFQPLVAPHEEHFLKALWKKRKTDRLYSAVGRHLIDEMKREVSHPLVQGSVVAPNYEQQRYEQVYQEGVRITTGVGFGRARAMADGCEPVAAIVETRIQQTAACTQKARMRKGRASEAGWCIRMRRGEEEATLEDRAVMAEIEQFVEEAGFTEPPEAQRPLNWEPGLEPFVRAFVKDSITLDWACIRRWGPDPEYNGNPKRFPITAFCAIDAACVRRFRAPLQVDDKNKPFLINPPSGRLDTKDPTRFVLTDSPSDGGRIVEAYTAKDVACGIRNPRTDIRANGYGHSEIDRLVHAITIWCYSRNYNGDRFKRDSLPRGILTVLGNLDEQHFRAFREEWMSCLKGNRWALPILQANPQAGSQFNWVPMDMSPRDMEYHQFMFTVALWAHAIFKIHPEETGFEALSPFRPPLSEASPEVRLRSSQDLGLKPLLRWLQGFINKELIWKFPRWKRYMLEFVGLGDWDELQDSQARGMRLMYGLSTPRMEWNELDNPIPDALKDSPMWDLPMIPAQGLAYLDQKEMMKEQMAAQQQQAAQPQPGMGQMMAMGGGPQGMPVQGAAQGQAAQPMKPAQPAAMNKSFDEVRKAFGV